MFALVEAGFGLLGCLISEKMMAVYGQLIFNLTRSDFIFKLGSPQLIIPSIFALLTLN